jgi:hypothetical protein
VYLSGTEKVVNKIRENILFPVTFFSKILPFMRYVEKYCRTEKVTYENMAHALCMMDVLGYKHALRICDTYCFFTTTMVARTGLNVR